MTAPWRELFDRVADGIQSEADERELAAALETSAAARREYRAFMELHSALHWDSTCLAQPPARSVFEAEHDLTRDADPVVNPAPESAAGRRASWHGANLGTSLVPLVVVATVLATSVGIVSLVAGRRGPPPVAADRPPLAVVTKTRFLVPGEGTTPVAAGRPFDGGRLTLRDGAVELMLRNDVVIVVQGPAELDLVDEMTAVLHDGTVVVRMPAGRQGFRVRTTSTDVLDLGTEFAVSIGAGNTTDVQVYDGAVIASTGSPPRAARLPNRLVAGEAMRFRPEPSAEPLKMAFRPERFVRKLPDDPGIPYHLSTASDPAFDRHFFGPAEHGGITVHRAPAGVAIDGRLDEWTAAPGFRGTLDGSPGCPEWADGRMMYDETFLYIAARVGDPLSLRSVVDPKVEPGNGWQGGGLQVRVSTDRQMGWPAVGNGPSYYGQRKIEPTAEQKQLAKNPRLRHLTMWFHAATQTPCLTVQEGMLFGDPQVNPAGSAGAFRADADGKGYTLEYAIPWTVLGCADDPPRSGDVLAAVWQVLWSDEAGRMRRAQMVEVRNPGEPLRIHVWERAATWGRAEYQ